MGFIVREGETVKVNSNNLLEYHEFLSQPFLGEMAGRKL